MVPENWTWLRALLVGVAVWRKATPAPLPAATARAEGNLGEHRLSEARVKSFPFNCREP